MTTIERHRTAMQRAALSRPVALALDDGLIADGVTVFDYGCGRGGDVERLQAIGTTATGWDPAFAPDAPRVPADVVNLGYVVNVIERPQERAAALQAAWSLTERVLVISARLEWEARTLVGRALGDGLVTAKGTFQKLFRQEELRDWLQAVLGVQPVAAAPGIFYMFRDEIERQRYLSGRVRRHASAPRPLVSEQLYETHRHLFEQLGEFVSRRGRLPRDTELACADEIKISLGSIGRAFAMLRRVTGAERWQQISDERARDLLVYLALANFGGRPSFSGLPPELQLDVRDLFGSYKAATSKADELLFAAGNAATIDLATRAATIGKLTQEALYVHASCLVMLPPVLRVYEGCGRALAGTVDGANVLKLHRQKAQVSYLEYPTFDTEAHPALSTVVIARLPKLDITYRDFRESTNPPILHRKETFVDETYPGRNRFAKLTAAEERRGILADSLTIGTRDGWQAVLEGAGLRVAGHQLRRVSSTPEKEAANGEVEDANADVG